MWCYGRLVYEINVGAGEVMDGILWQELTLEQAW